MAKILIVGCGDIGAALGVRLKEQGHDVTGLRRHPPENNSAINYIKADVSQREELSELEFDYDQLLYILSPSSVDLGSYQAVFSLGVKNLLDCLKVKNSNLAITFVSSTRVYGQTSGEWLDESSVTEPTDGREKILLAAEKMILDFNDESTVVRFSGIYGRSNHFLNQLKKGIEIQETPSYYTNRIHRDDCIGVLDFIMNKKLTRRLSHNVFLASDSEPTNKWELALYLSDLFGYEKPTPLVLRKEADANKRISNTRLKQAGYVFKFDSFRQGYI